MLFNLFLYISHYIWIIVMYFFQWSSDSFILQNKHLYHDTFTLIGSEILSKSQNRSPMVAFGTEVIYQGYIFMEEIYLYYLHELGLPFKEKLKLRCLLPNISVIDSSSLCINSNKPHYNDNTNHTQLITWIHFVIFTIGKMFDIRIKLK